MHAETLSEFSTKHQAKQLQLRQGQASPARSIFSTKRRLETTTDLTPKSHSGRSASKSGGPASRTASRASSRASSAKKRPDKSGVKSGGTPQQHRSPSVGISSPSFGKANTRRAHSAEKTAGLQLKIDAQNAEIRRLREQLELQTYMQKFITQELAATTELIETGRGLESPYYTVTFGPEPIGMIVVLNSQREVVVGELRDGPDGTPLAAKASGKVRLGDLVCAVNERNLAAHTTLTEVSRDFREAGRPVRVLFRRSGPAGAPYMAGTSRADASGTE